MDNSPKSTQEKNIRLLRPNAHDQYRLPDIDDLATRLRFVPAKGEIWFDDRRMVLLQSFATGGISGCLQTSGSSVRQITMRQPAPLPTKPTCTIPH